ncbi:MAG: acetyl-CoA carboxylase biotin carboxyl carrier protein subunit [Lachnospiraceae bacterium]|nr:acetyl-CoA carboxylase biotin carboxyl carrier protein subunit [Lachnospiraceae bacterium]
MKNYTITVNGTAYDVTVEETGSTASAPAPAVKKAAPAPKATPAPAAAAGSAGGVEVKAGAAGKVFKLDTKVGDSVKKGDPVVTIEAMKMEIPVVAPQDGTVASINCSVGDACESGQVLATLN